MKNLTNPYTLGVENGVEVNQHVSFESAFKNKGKLKTSGGVVTTVDLKPENALATPLLVIPGWSITLETEKPLLEDFYNASKHVISLEFPRKPGGKVEKHENFPREIVREAEMIAELITSNVAEGGKIDVTAHSMGVLGLIAAILLRPEIAKKIGSVVLTAAGPLAYDNNFFKFLGRFTRHFRQDLGDAFKFGQVPVERKMILKMMLETSKYVLKNPPRALSEARAGAEASTYGSLDCFRDTGIKVGIIQGADDRFFKAEKMWDKIGEGSVNPFVASDEPDGRKQYEPKDNPVPSFNTITIVGGGHDDRIYGKRGFAGKILREFELLERMADPDYQAQTVKRIEFIRQSVRDFNESKKKTN